MNLLLAYVGSPRFRKAMRSKPGQKGFSLIELIIAVAVIAILSAAVLPQFANQSVKAANATAKDILSNAVKECGAKMAENNVGASSVTTKVLGPVGADASVKGYTIAASTTYASGAYPCNGNFSAVAANPSSTGLQSYCYKYSSSDDTWSFQQTVSSTPCA